MSQILLEDQLQRFQSLLETLKSVYTISSPCPWAYVLSPQSSQATAKSVNTRPKKIPLAFLALIHGNEPGGLAILTEFLEYLSLGGLRLEFPVGLALGNLAAARQGLRFLEHDLNRSFASPQQASGEILRAQQLEKFLGEVGYLLDFHQTLRPSAHPFFIFPYTKAGVRFAQSIAPTLPIVTHWQAGFSTAGQCSDEYVNACGGVGITLETGQGGFDPYQTAVGFSACLRAYNSLAHGLNPGARASALQPPRTEFYTWGEIQAYPATGRVELIPSLNNFMPVSAGTVLAYCDGRPVRAACTGKILFPKYLDTETPPQQRPKELYRIIVTVKEDNLGQATKA